MQHNIAGEIQNVVAIMSVVLAVVAAALVVVVIVVVAAVAICLHWDVGWPLNLHGSDDVTIIVYVIHVSEVVRRRLARFLGFALQTS